MEVPIEIFQKNSILLGRLFIPDNIAATPRVIVMCYGLNGNQVEQHRMSVHFGREAVKYEFVFVCFDFRNQGLSDGEFFNLTLSDRLEDLLRVIEFIKGCFPGRKPVFTVIGFSFGANTAVQSALDCEDISNLLLWNPVFGKALSIEEPESERTVRFSMHPTYRKPYKKYLGLRLNVKFLQEIKVMQTEDLMQKLQVKMLIIFGDKDNFTLDFQQHLLENKNVLPDNVEVHYIKDADHLFGLSEHEKQVIEKSLQWLKIGGF